MRPVVSRSWNALILAAAAVGLVGMSLVLPATVANAKDLAATGSPVSTSTRSASPGNLRQLLPRLVRPMLSASTPTAKTVTASYSCDFSGYGAGITAATMSATFGYPSSWPVNQPMPLEFTINSVTLPSQVSTALTGVNSMTIAATVTAANATQATIPVSGPTSATLPNPPTMIPQTEVEGQVTFPAKGTGEVDLPAPAIVITPVASGGGAAPSAITCTTTTTAQPESITVGAASGPFYSCVLAAGSGGSGNTETSSGFTDITLTESGAEQVGKTVPVTLSSGDIAANIVVLAAAFQQAGVPLTKVVFTAALAVTGAQSGALHPSATVTDVTDTSFSTSEGLKLSKAGMTAWTSPRRGALAST